MKKKIAVIGLKGLPALGGASTVGENIIKNLKNDYEFEVLSISNYASEKNIYNIKQTIFKSISNSKINIGYYYVRCLIYVLFQKKFDLIHLHHSESGFITPFLRLRYKVVTTYHGMFLNGYKDPKFSSLVNYFFRFSQFLNIKFSNVNVSVSSQDLLYLKSKNKHGLARYISNGVDTFLSNSNNSSLGYVCFAANRIYEIKGLHILIDAIKIANFQKKVIVIGELNHVPKYKKKILESLEGLEIEFLGLVRSKSELFKIIKGSDFFVFPSIKESMSMMLLEVASLKIPVIASDIPENKCLFEEDEIFYFESNSPDSLSKKLLFLNSNLELGKIYAERAFQKVEKDFSWQRIASEYSKIYDYLLRIRINK
ncbi:glycosyltransferase family 4 protein [Aquiflexum sp. LQ15W]|uniref:glycosyltransferase family 4 protein n=1 Tax=Cognataquiflexum nitidum TaxID=2922272 RepID=UPI001F12BD3E|nr:glycosyltransferase family 4 protein [Cognataquiflexum nitidum]MCH6199265.1 glycosyltransferase family 4 protein [Cognataquiflexum nitidum]